MIREKFIQFLNKFRFVVCMRKKWCVLLRNVNKNLKALWLKYNFGIYHKSGLSLAKFHTCPLFVVVIRKGIPKVVTYDWALPKSEIFLYDKSGGGGTGVNPTTRLCEGRTTVQCVSSHCGKGRLLRRVNKSLWIWRISWRESSAPLFAAAFFFGFTYTNLHRTNISSVELQLSILIRLIG